MKYNNSIKKINYNFQLLRLILCFWVVIQHCYKYSNKLRKGLFHVPIFMIMSFYFSYNIIKTKDTIKIKQRFQRILILYIFWPIFVFILNNILFKFEFSLYNKKLLLNDLVKQIIFGRSYHNFYYLFILMVLTLFFIIISFLFNKSMILIFHLLLIIVYIFQYSYWNLFIFKEYSRVIKLSLGIIAELLPFAVMGITLRNLDINTKLIKLKRLTIFYIGVIIFLILKFEIFVRIRGFYYPGILLNIGGTCIFILFSLFSFQNKKLIFILKIITKFTGGIFYIHLTCFILLQKKIFFIKNMTFHGSIVIYIICYIICHLGNKLTYKTKFKFLFN